MNTFPTTLTNDTLHEVCRQLSWQTGNQNDFNQQLNEWLKPFGRSRHASVIWRSSHGMTMSMGMVFDLDGKVMSF